MTRARDRLVVCGFGRGNGAQGAGTADQRSWHKQIFETLSNIGEPIKTPFGEGYRVGAPLKADARVLESKASVALPDWVRRPLAAAQTASCIA